MVAAEGTEQLMVAATLHICSQGQLCSAATSLTLMSLQPTNLPTCSPPNTHAHTHSLTHPIGHSQPHPLYLSISVSAITLEGQTATKRGERVENPNIYKLPLTRFGPYTPNTKTKGCHPDTPDKWAFGTCTLLRAVGPREVAPGAASECMGVAVCIVWLCDCVPDVELLSLHVMPNRHVFKIPTQHAHNPTQHYTTLHPPCHPSECPFISSSFSVFSLSSSFCCHPTPYHTTGTGWVSALLTAPVPQQCAGLSAAACAACSSSPDPASCISCMTDKRATSYVESISLVGDHVPRESVGGRTLDQCLSCVKMTDKAAQKKWVFGCFVCEPHLQWHTAHLSPPVPC